MKYFPGEINSEILNYLEDFTDCEMLVTKSGMNPKYYTSKLYHTVKDYMTSRYRIDKLVIKSDEDLQYIKNKKTILKVVIGDYFDKNVSSDDFPKNITELTFGEYFNKEIIDLPKKLTRLEFGFGFNQKIDKLPKGITELQLGEEFECRTNLSKYPQLKLIIVKYKWQLKLFINKPKKCKIIIE